MRSSLRSMLRLNPVKPAALLSQWMLKASLIGGRAAVAIAPLVIAAPVQAAELTRWSFDPETNQLEVQVPGGTTPNYFLLAQPARIVLDLPNTNVGNVVEERQYSGAVRYVRVGQFQPNLTRIVIELAPDAVLAPAQVELRNVGSAASGRSERWVLRPLLAGDAPVAAIEPVPSTPIPDGVDEPDDLSSEGVVFEPSAHSAEGDLVGDLSADDLSIEEQQASRDRPANSSSQRQDERQAADVEPAAPREANPQGRPQDQESTVSTQTDIREETQAAAATDAAEAAPGDLPPLEPGAFEIPVVIPPPIADRPNSEASSHAGEEAEFGDEEPDDEATVSAQEDSLEDGADLPVAIAPPESGSDTPVSVSRSDMTSSSDPVDSDPVDNDLDSNTATSVSASDDSSQTVRQIEVTTAEEFQQALNEITTGNANIQIVRRFPGESAASSSEAGPEADPGEDSDLQSSQSEEEAVEEVGPEPIEEVPDSQPLQPEQSQLGEDVAEAEPATIEPQLPQPEPDDPREALSEDTDLPEPEVPDLEEANDPAGLETSVETGQIESNRSDSNLEEENNPELNLAEPDSAEPNLSTPNLSDLDSAAALETATPELSELSDSDSVAIAPLRTPEPDSLSLEPSTSTELPDAERAEESAARVQTSEPVSSSDAPDFPAPDREMPAASPPPNNGVIRELPPAMLDGDQAVTVNIPGLDELRSSSEVAIATPDEPDEPMTPATSAPPASFSEPSSPASSTAGSLESSEPELPSPASALPTAPAAPTPRSSVTLARQGDRQLVVAARPDALIPSGTVLTLRYPRLTSTLLQTGIAWQDVLLLEQTIRDRTGRVIAPEGSQIIGRFEVTDRRVRFVTQAIALDGRNIPLRAVSGWVPISNAVDAVVIRPNQIVNVRLADNFVP